MRGGCAGRSWEGSVSLGGCEGVPESQELSPVVSALCSFIVGITQIADFNGAVRERGNSSSRVVQGSVLVVSGCSERSIGDKLTPGLEEPSCGPAVAQLCSSHWWVLVTESRGGSGWAHQP